MPACLSPLFATMAGNVLLFIACKVLPSCQAAKSEFLSLFKPSAQKCREISR